MHSEFVAPGWNGGVKVDYGSEEEPFNPQIIGQWY